MLPNYFDLLKKISLYCGVLHRLIYVFTSSWCLARYGDFRRWSLVWRLGWALRIESRDLLLDYSIYTSGCPFIPAAMENKPINSFFSKLLLLVLFHKAKKKVSSAICVTIVWPEATGLPIGAGNAITFGKWLATVLIAFRFVYFLCYMECWTLFVPFAFHLSNVNQSLLTLTIHGLWQDAEW